jgi:hypothetical protein
VTSEASPSPLLFEVEETFRYRAISPDVELSL